MGQLDRVRRTNHVRHSPPVREGDPIGRADDANIGISIVRCHADCISGTCLGCSDCISTAEPLGNRQQAR